MVCKLFLTPLMTCVILSNVFFSWHDSWNSKGPLWLYAWTQISPQNQLGHLHPDSCTLLVPYMGMLFKWRLPPSAAKGRQKHVRVQVEERKLWRTCSSLLSQCTSTWHKALIKPWILCVMRAAINMMSHQLSISLHLCFLFLTSTGQILKSRLLFLFTQTFVP